MTEKRGLTARPTAAPAAGWRSPLCQPPRRGTGGAAPGAGRLLPAPLPLPGHV